MSRALDELLPDYDFAERHRVELDSAETALDAAKRATPAEMPFVRLLFVLRSGPALVTRARGLPRAKDRPLAEQMVEFGFVPLVDEENELVLGFVGQPWKLSGGTMPRLDADAWRSFDEPGYAKAVMNFRADNGVLETETRVKLTDEMSRRRFARYWRLIRPFSGLIRRSYGPRAAEPLVICKAAGRALLRARRRRQAVRDPSGHARPAGPASA